MATTTIVTSNVQLKASLEAIRQIVNSSHTLRLFTNNLTPDPETQVSSFVEASFGGYAPISLANALSGAFKASSGVLQASSPVFTWLATAGPPQSAFGWFVLGPGGVKYSARLTLPFDFSSFQPLSIQLVLQERSLSIACP